MVFGAKTHFGGLGPGFVKGFGGGFLNLGVTPGGGLNFRENTIF